MRKLLIIIAVPAMFFLGCKPKPAPTNVKPTPPVACFDISKALIDSGETVTTTNCSTNASSYAWNFGLGLQSSSTANAPTYTYTNPARGTKYLVKLIAYGSDNQSNEKDTNVTLGYRRIDSVVVKNIPGFAPLNTTTIALQFGPASDISEFNSPQIAPTGYPFTFNLTALSPKVYINSTDQQSWKGRIINISTTQTIYPIVSTSTNPGAVSGGAPWPIYFSRGLDNNPIKVTDNIGFEMDVYYSISAVDK